MILRELLHDIGGLPVIPVSSTGIQQLVLHTGAILDNCTIDFNLEVKGVTCNPRKVKDGYLFVCVSEEGERCVGSVKASAIIAGFNAVPVHGAETYIFYPNPLDIYSKIVSRFYRFKQLKCVAAVTGTNGKTSVVEFCRQIWQNAGYNAASVGTLGTCVNNERKDNNSGLTTPDADDLYFTLRDVNSKNIERLALEASSHGIDQYRIHGLALNAAAFTNFSQDHLDYHKDVSKYFEAKKRLFYEVLPEEKTAVLNSDIDEYYTLLKIAKKRNSKVITYGKTGSDITLLRQIPTPDGQHLTIKIGNKVYRMFFPVLGQFQAYNLLCAIGIVIVSKLDYRKICINKLVSLPGRIEKVKPFAFVDYAHTPSALKQALLSLKWHFNKKIVLVFGCGGNRDQVKRAEMGKIAKVYADRVIVTDDNPRGEDPAKIRRDILLYCSDGLEVRDRRKAIRKGINIAYDENMILLVAGKGHERFQIVGNKTFEFSDVEVIKNHILMY
ncbi:UDP-N-acetylmuramyl-tripeptide synthetase [Wolbachia endosymbiont of Litomosoides brasiliensis]|uniref:Mur ligase family protein n=1 Tax=Wolbachia endosymbiont of Litomosoides brasiliensis TaxID=1812117 RepID=UPI00158F1DDB|nr:UDP-N-acetylmuramoyl-L-alanyl-D-glutamate--2,6-diaminopimelate ligase [Wolbachia endosymbiont of Litomosoides brasiliensis]NUY39261.1 UDP-N-acetylmuramyl-tripeptide synthetase [Wolbachia endosymbiont of Litomosoides brasiliensis]